MEAEKLSKSYVLTKWNS